MWRSASLFLPRGAFYALNEVGQKNLDIYLKFIDFFKAL